MPPKNPKPTYSRWREKKFVIPKIALRNTPSFFQEFFYYFLAAITLGMMLLLKGSGMSGSNAIVIGLWMGAILWFAQMARGYFKARNKPTSPSAAPKQPGADANLEKKKWEPPKGMKPMIGPQWPLFPGSPGAGISNVTSADEKKNKPGFVYERPTLPGRRPRLPANWSSKDKKKPKP
jgi:predicted lipid-binding transport protein (Tim44 family)